MGTGEGGEWRLETTPDLGLLYVFTARNSG